MKTELCAWCGKEVKPEDQRASRGDEVHWHAECFVKHLAHVDEIRGITR
jgi:hypothetical protein